MKKIFLGILLIVAVLFLIGIGYLGYLGFIPSIAKILGTDKPRDLGITYTQEDYQSADQKAQVQIATREGAADPEQSLILEGSKNLQDSFTDNELTAVINEHEPNWSYYPVRDVQVKINPDGSGEVSGILRLDRIMGYAQATGAPQAAIQTVMEEFDFLPEQFPFYLKLSPVVQNRTVSMNISSAEIGRAGIPQDMISDNAGAINAFFTQQINAFPGFAASSVDLDGGNLNFQGTVPEKVTTFKD